MAEICLGKIMHNLRRITPLYKTDWDWHDPSHADTPYIVNVVHSIQSLLVAVLLPSPHIGIIMQRQGCVTDYCMCKNVSIHFYNYIILCIDVYVMMLL